MSVDSLFTRELRALPQGVALREQFLELAESDPLSHVKSSGPRHFTASGIVVDSSGEYVALHFHKKVQAWLQFGGHIEPGEQSFLEAALREVREEAGLSELEVCSEGPLVLHAHALNSNFAACSEHWDVQYLLRTSFVPSHAQDGLRLSGESESLSWFKLRDLPQGIVGDLIPTLSGPVKDLLGR